MKREPLGKLLREEWPFSLLPLVVVLVLALVRLVLGFAPNADSNFVYSLF